MKHILVVYPLPPTRVNLASSRIASRYRISYLGEDTSKYLDSLDVNSFIDEVVEWARTHAIDGILSSRDYPGSIIAHAAAEKLGLPHVDPRILLSCQHKYVSRILQQKIVPHATPSFFLIEEQAGNNQPLPYPFFVKPIKSFFSMLSRKVYNEEELEKIKRDAKGHLQKFTRPLDDLIKIYAPEFPSSSFLIGESLLEGIQVTVEGFLHNGSFTLIGIVDSFMYPGTHSFSRFEYPCHLPSEVQLSMTEIAKEFLTGIGYTNAIANIEMMYNPMSDDIKIIEVNPRMCSQFADLMEKVHGTNTYEIQLALSCGEKPRFTSHAGKYQAAASFPFRIFEDKKIRRLPSSEDLTKVYEVEPDARVEICGEVGGKLSDDLQDGMSYLYCILNIGANSHEELMQKSERLHALLPFGFESV